MVHTKRIEEPRFEYRFFNGNTELTKDTIGLSPLTPCETNQAPPPKEAIYFRQITRFIFNGLRSMGEIPDATLKMSTVQEDHANYVMGGIVELSSDNQDSFFNDLCAKMKEIGGAEQQPQTVTARAEPIARVVQKGMTP
jgi:hypothetical protein